MSYIGGCYLCGDLPTAETVADSTSTSLQQANFKRAYEYLKTLNAGQLDRIAAQANKAVASLSPSDREYVQSIAQITARTDPRAAGGLGAFGLEAIASIASTVATLGTLGLQTFSFLDQKKQSEAQASAQKKIANAQAAAIQAETAAVQQQTAAALQPAPATTSTAKSFVIPAAIIGGGLALVAVVFAMRRK